MTKVYLVVGHEPYDSGECEGVYGKREDAEFRQGGLMEEAEENGWDVRYSVEEWEVE